MMPIKVNTNVVCITGVLVLAVVLNGRAHAATVGVTYSADNEVVAGYYRTGGTATPFPLGPNATDWTMTDTSSLSLADNTPYQIVFRASDSGGAAMFIAEVSGEATGNLLTSTAWEVAFDTGGPAPTDFNTLSWFGATDIGPNGTGPWGTRTAISSSARYIWTGDNDLDNNIWVRTRIVTDLTVPEPTTAALGLLGFASLLMRRRRSA